MRQFQLKVTDREDYYINLFKRKFDYSNKIDTMRRLIRDAGEKLVEEYGANLPELFDDTLDIDQDNVDDKDKKQRE